MNAGDVARLHMRATYLSQVDQAMILEDTKVQVVMCELKFTNWDDLDERKDCRMLWENQLTSVSSESSQPQDESTID